MNNEKNNFQPLISDKEQQESKKFSWAFIRKSLKRIFRYAGVRVLTVLLTVGVGLYITLVVANLGGFVDEIQKAQIGEMIGGMGLAGAFDDIPEDELQEYVANLQLQIEEAWGLHEPLLLRTARWWFNGITLNWGTAERMTTLDRESNLVADVIFERLPFTLLLVGAANVILFFLSLGVAMLLSSHRGRFWDRLLSSLTPISSAPSWVHGVILLAIFALELRILPFKGMFTAAPPEDPLRYILDLLKHMILPVMAVVLSIFFQSVYTWRTFFIVHSGEDFVELAKAKGLPDRLIRRRYLMRPTLPSIITSFALMLVGLWEGAIALEVLFNWTGVGALFLNSIYMFDRPVIVAMVVMFAYLLGFSVMMLDIIYALIDPRVRIGKNGKSVQKRPANAFKFSSLFRRRKNRAHLKKTQHDFFGEPLRVDSTVKSLKSKAKRNGQIKQLFRTIRSQIVKFPFAVVGLVVIVLLFIVSVYTVITIPYDDAVEYWHSEGLMLAPKLARPSWINLFRKEKLPESIFFDSTQSTEGVISETEMVDLGNDVTDIRMTFKFNYDADDFPQDITIYFESTYEEKVPFANIYLITPDGREIEIASFSVPDQKTFILSQQDITLVSNNKLPTIQTFMGDPTLDYAKPLKGTYAFRVLAVVFEEDADVDVQASFHGKVFGFFGTDNQRRDLTIAMMWGTPVALTFGIIGAVTTTFTTILIAAVSAWYGGIVDEILQRITELNIILPAIPIAILVYILYSKSIWVILAVMILMNIFGNNLKEYRAMFLQFKEAPYIEAAVAYGASGWRIITKYLLPRILQVMVPQLVISVPSFVFLESTLAYLGVITPYLPTWGKVINMGLAHGTFWGHYFWVLEPIILVLITGLAFAFVGFALDSILNPRIRDR